jgi:hypothetical protein
MLLIDDKTLKEANISEKEMRRELALMLYRRGRLPLDKASKLAQMTERSFRKLLDAAELSTNPGWNDMYGIAPGLLKGRDAQDYVNDGRRERL